MKGLLLDAIYATGLLAISPIWLYRMIRHGRYRSGISQRLGAVPVRYGLQPIIWVHGVSLGEINASRTLVDELNSQLPDYRVVISSTTDTGMAAARRLFEPDHIVFQWPMDFSLAVGKALKRLKPDLVVLMEGEVWPNFLTGCKKRNVPVVVVNGRLSRDKGYPRYKKLGSLAAKLFNKLTAIGVQEEVYAELYKALGVDAEKLHVTGMMKFDSAHVADRIDGQDELAGVLGLTEQQKLIVAGGTGPGEEQMLLDFWAELRRKHPQARLAIVPRKPERFDDVAKRITASGFGLIRRSECQGSSSRAGIDAVILGDTMGELRKFYSLADCVFVGRSLVPMGGSDMIESAALGKPTAFGPHTFNFPKADGLAKNGCIRVANADELKDQLSKWLSDEASAKQAGKAAQDYVRSQQGATRHNVEMICGVLGRVPAVASGGIATDVIEQEA